GRAELWLERHRVGCRLRPLALATAAIAPSAPPPAPPASGIIVAARRFGRFVVIGTACRHSFVARLALLVDGSRRGGMLGVVIRNKGTVLAALLAAGSTVPAPPASSIAALTFRRGFDTLSFAALAVAGRGRSLGLVTHDIRARLGRFVKLGR